MAINSCAYMHLLCVRILKFDFYVSVIPNIPNVTCALLQPYSVCRRDSISQYNRSHELQNFYWIFIFLRLYICVHAHLPC